MATLNSELQPERMTVSDVSTKFQANDIYIDDTYQRRGVWIKKNKVRLIETILLGLPMPEIYLWESRPDPETGKIKLSVVDGQQRLRTINEFIAKEFKLTATNLDKENKNKDFANKTFDNLSDADRSNLWNYRLNVRVLPYYLSRDQIIAIFLRLNETDKSLNPQELRHAKFDGKFIKAAIEIADFSFWEKWGLFSPSRIRRMHDVLLASQFLAFLRRGIEGDISAKAINDLYDSFNEDYRAKNSDINKCKDTIEFIDSVFEEDRTISTFFKSQAHLYPLLISSYIFLQRGNVPTITEITKRLGKFTIAYRGDQNNYDGVESYRRSSLEGLSSKSSRESRVKFMLSILDGSFVY